MKSRYQPLFEEENQDDKLEDGGKKEKLKFKDEDFKTTDSNKWNVIQDAVKFILETIQKKYKDISMISKDGFVELTKHVLELNKKDPYKNWKEDVGEIYERIYKHGKTL